MKKRSDKRTKKVNPESRFNFRLWYKKSFVKNSIIADRNPTLLLYISLPNRYKIIPQPKAKIAVGNIARKFEIPKDLNRAAVSQNIKGGFLKKG